MAVGDSIPGDNRCDSIECPYYKNGIQNKLNNILKNLQESTLNLVKMDRDFHLTRQ